MKYKTVCWHYVEHVRGRGLIKSYSISWMGRKHDARRGGAPGMRLSYIPMSILVRDASEGEKFEISSTLNRTPFLYRESFGGHYYAQLFVPFADYSESMSYLMGFMRKVPERSKLYIIDQGGSLSLPLPTHLFSRETQRWQLDVGDVLTRMENLYMKARVGAK
jgi:hypothetical protein